MPQRSGLYSRWSHEMRHSGFFRAGDRVGVAVSGGPDSVLLFTFMEQLGREMGLQVAVAHFNHQLRGPESDADERFVRELAEKSNVEFLSSAGNVAEVARARHRNLEATARELRYRFFFALVNQGKVTKVATAHTANDQAETVLLKLLRGASTRGLGGIYPVLEGKVVRPFLSVTRAEVEAEIRGRGLPFRVDSTNRDTNLARNKIRMKLLPLLERQFNPAIVSLLKGFADRARDDEDYLEQQAAERARPWRRREGPEERIGVRALAALPAAIERRVLRQMIAAVRGSLRGVTAEHIESLVRFARESQSGRHLTFPAGLVARREFEWLIVGLATPVAVTAFSYAVKVPGEVSIPQLGLAISIKIVDAAEARKAYNHGGVVCLDADKLPGELVLRNWHPGDRYQPPGHYQPVAVKELFSRRRVPVGERRAWPVLEGGSQVLWVRGFAPAVAISAESGRVLVISENPVGLR